MLLAAAAVVATCALGAWWVEARSRDRSPAVHSLASLPERAPMCPWREPEADVARFFPGATGHTTEVIILSGARMELRKRLGRTPTPDENVLYVHRVRRQSTALGALLTRRVKGEFGAIELVLAVDPGGVVRGLRYQRLREPAVVSAQLQAPAWIQAFRGKTADSPLRPGADLPQVSPEAATSAAAIAEGVREQLVLLEVATQRGVHQSPGAAHH